MAKDAKKGHRAVNRSNSKAEKAKKELIASLLQKCTSYTNVTGDELHDIYSLIGQIDQLEQPFTSILPNMSRTDESFDQFLHFCSTNGVDTSNVCIAPIEGYDGEFGLKAKSNIKEGQVILTIPRQLILTVDDYMYNLTSAPRKSESDKSFIEFISSDPLLSEMPNLVLAMIVMREFTDEKSFWQPYFKILPVTYKTPLFFDLNDFAQLKCTSVYEEATRLLRSIARQYSYFWTQMQSSRSPASRISFRKHFTFKFYRWAVSTVMTRQNLVPSFPGHANGNSNGKASSNALIPLWDMCNHRNGKFSTDFDAEKDAVICYAMDDFDVSSQIVIHYGNRANRDFFLHNGFVDVENDHDFINLRLGISKSDPLASSKVSLCNKINIPSNGLFTLKRAKCARDESVVAFLRIFHMNQDELQHWLSKENFDDFCQLFTSDNSQFTHLDSAVTKFLAIRASLLMKNYPKDEDLAKLTNENIRRMIQIDLSVFASYLG